MRQPRGREPHLGVAQRLPEQRAAGDLQVDWAFKVDTLTRVMLVVR